MKLRRVYVAFFASLFAFNAHAVDVKGVFDSYNSNSGGVFNTSQGQYLHLGSFHGRIPQKNVEFLRFTPPAISGSCSGIDIFAGSFGLVSGDELVQVARGVAQGAAPYFFNLAMQSICPSCANVMSEISDVVNELNRFGQNSCQNIFDSIDQKYNIEGRIKGWADTSGTLKMVNEGLKDTWLTKTRDALKGASWGDVFSNLDENSRKSVNTNVTSDLVSLNASNLQMTMIGINSKQDMSEFLTSVVGSIVVAAKGSAECQQNQGSSKKCFDITAVAPVLSFETLYYGKQAGDELKFVYQCADSNCQGAMSKQEYNGEGLAQLFEREIAGENGIIKRLRAKEQLSETQIKIRQATRAPFEQIAINPSFVSSLEYGRYVARMIALSLIRDIASQVNNLLAKGQLNSFTDEQKSLYAKELDILKGGFEQRYEEFLSKAETDLDRRGESLKTLLAFAELTKLNLEMSK